MILKKLKGQEKFALLIQNAKANWVIIKGLIVKIVIMRKIILKDGMKNEQRVFN